MPDNRGGELELLPPLQGRRIEHQHEYDNGPHSIPCACFHDILVQAIMRSSLLETRVSSLDHLPFQAAKAGLIDLTTGDLASFD